jgi:SRSO17 transposase
MWTILQVRAVGLKIEAVLADAAYGNVQAFRTAVDRMGLPYAVGVARRLAVTVTGARRSYQIGRLIKRLPTASWRRVCWTQGTKGPLAARFAALRVRPTNNRAACWLLCERPLANHCERKAYLLNLPASASLKALVRLARGRWPIISRAQLPRVEPSCRARRHDLHVSPTGAPTGHQAVTHLSRGAELDS